MEEPGKLSDMKKDYVKDQYQSFLRAWDRSDEEMEPMDEEMDGAPLALTALGSFFFFFFFYLPFTIYTLVAAQPAAISRSILTVAGLGSFERFFVVRSPATTTAPLVYDSQAELTLRIERAVQFLYAM
jgi:hypothetical protein